MLEKNETQAQEEMELEFSGTHYFKKAVTFEGTAYSQVEYDLDALTAKDVISCRKEVARINKASGEMTSMISDDLLHAVLFARSADLPAGFVLEMGAADYAAWSMVGQAFFASALSGLMS